MPHTLLLADDSVTIQRVIELTFADEDVQVVAVGDGNQAIERIDQAPPDIVLADIGMPGKSGYEVAQHVKRTPRLAHIPVVLLTGAFEPVDQARATEAGCDGVLAKPFEPQLVISRVKELLAQPRDAAGALHAEAAPRPAAAGRWEPTIVERPAVPPPAEPVELGDYFDRLDVAFANLPTPPVQPPGPVPPPLPDDLDWLGINRVEQAPAPAAEPWELAPPPPLAAEADFSLTYASPEPAIETTASSPVPEQPAVSDLDRMLSALEQQQQMPPAEGLGAPPAEAVTLPEIAPIPPAVDAPPPIIEEAQLWAVEAPPPPVESAMPPVQMQAPVEVPPPVERTPPPVEHMSPWIDAGSPWVEQTSPWIEQPGPRVEETASAIAEAAPHQPPAVAQAPAAIEPAPAPAAPVEAPREPAPPASVPPLADAFAALLAAEKQETLPPVAPAWPASAPAQEELVERIAQRVLDRLADQTVVRSTVGDLVSSIAERLVREEIERIKKSVG